jgi:hypothetical protein
MNVMSRFAVFGGSRITKAEQRAPEESAQIVGHGMACSSASYFQSLPSGELSRLERYLFGYNQQPLNTGLERLSFE